MPETLGAYNGHYVDETLRKLGMFPLVTPIYDVKAEGDIDQRWRTLGKIFVRAVWSHIQYGHQLITTARALDKPIECFFHRKHRWIHALGNVCSFCFRLTGLFLAFR